MKKARVESKTERALAFLKQHPEGATQKALQEELQTSPEALKDLMQNLISRHLVDVYRRGGETLFKEKTGGLAVKMKGLTKEDQLVFQSIKEADNQGVWSREIQRKSNLAQATVTKILKNLEERRLVKSVHTVSGGRRKIYVPFDVEPAAELTGGVWFQGQELDTVFIQDLKDLCRQYVEHHKRATARQVQQAFQQSNTFSVPLSEEQLSTVLTTLVYDGVLENAPAVDDEETWQMKKWKIPYQTPLTAYPCGVCPVINDCTPGGLISPETCVYFDKFLQF